MTLIELSSNTHNLAIGNLGEIFVANWLIRSGWKVLHHQWHCRWGEIDLVAQHPIEQVAKKGALPTLIFVEVKTRRPGNWDGHGLLAVTAKKRKKLWQTARLFLATYPELSENSCRFDIALVHYQPIVSKPNQNQSSFNSNPANTKQHQPQLNRSQLNHSIVANGYQLTLQNYFAGAFEGD